MKGKPLPNVSRIVSLEFADVRVKFVWKRGASGVGNYAENYITYNRGAMIVLRG